MLTKTGQINWQETLAQIAEDKNQPDLAEYIRSFTGVFVSPNLGVNNLNITKMPEATCDGCQ